MFLDAGRFLIHVPRFSSRNNRFKTVGRAVARIAETLGTNIEVSQMGSVLSVWVYYQHSGEEIPVYCDWGKDWSEDDVFRVIKNKLHGLFRYPQLAVLQVIGGRWS